MSLKSRLAFLFFFISFTPSLLTGILTYNNYEKLFEKDEFNTLNYIADYKRNEIRLYVSALMDNIKSTQDSWCIRENLPQIIEFSEDPSNPKYALAKKILDERFQPTQKTWGLLDIMLADTNGRIVYGTNAEHVHYLARVPDPYEKSFKEGVKDLYITDVFTDPAENGKPKLLISAPDFSSKGSLIGVIIFEVDLAKIYAIIKNQTGLMSTGETLVATTVGDEVTYLTPLKYDLKESFTRHINMGGNLGIPIQRAVQGQDGYGYSTDYRGVRVMAAWRYLPELRWGLVAKIDKKEAFTEITILKKALYITFGILFALCLIISLAIARTIAGSREKLNKEVEERKKTSKELEKYKNHLESLVKERTAEISDLNRNIEFILGTTKTGLDIIDSDHNMVYVNPEWQKVYGDPKGRKCYEYFMGRDAECPICGVKEALEKKKPVVTEEILVKEGNRPIQVTTIPYQDKNGKWFVAEINVDITERKKIENALKESEQKMRKITDTVPSVIYTYQMTPDGKQKFLFISDMIKPMFGLSKEEALANFDNLWNLIIPEERDNLYKSIQASYRDRKLWQYEWKIKKADGEIKWIHGESTPEAPKEDGSIVWNGILSDVTLRKNLEEELRKHRDHLEDLVHIRTEDIRKNEEALREKELRYRMLFETAGDAIMLMRGDIFIDCNSRTLAVFGCNREQIISAPPYKFSPPMQPDGRNSKEKAIEKINKALAGEPQFFEWEHCRADGTPFPAEVHLNSLKVSGEVLLQAIVHDVTERKKTEEAVKASEVRYRRLFESAKDGILILNAETGRIVDANPFIENVLGYSAGELVGKELWEIGTFENIADSKEGFLELRKKGYIRYNNLPLMTKDGNIKEVEFISNSYKVDHTDVMQCNIRDITERRQIEAALEASEANYHSIFELASDAIMVYDIESYAMSDANEQACELLCYPKYELLKLPSEAIFPDDQPNNWEYVKPIFDKAAGGEPQSVELLFKDRAKRTFWAEVHIKRAVIGGIYRLLAIAHDISERKESENKITELNRSIAHANEELKKLALIDSHTGLYNYHYYSGVIEAEFARAQRQDGRLSLIMMDIDYFKSINDVYGHQFGDLILKQLAELLKKTVRLYDTIVRFGGEEFLIIAPGTGSAEAMKLVKRIFEAITSFPFGNNEHKVKLKISAACGSYPDDTRIRNSSDFIDIADFILSKAKEEGGNRAYSSLDFIQSGDKKLKEKEPDVISLKDKIVKLTTRGNQSVAEAIFAFAKTIELKDRYTGAHVDDTMRYAVMISEKLGLSEHEVELTKYAAALHDLGKVGIPEAILHKTGKLTEEEFNVIKLHPQIAADIIRPIHFLHDIIPAILHHHEHWDGSGYPTGLRKESIPLASRIVAVADAYQAMVSDRPYRKALGSEEAMKELKKYSGTQFDPKIVNIFLSVLRSENKSPKSRKK